MNKLFIILFAIAVIIAGISFGILYKNSIVNESHYAPQGGSNEFNNQAIATTMKITSTAFKANTSIPSRYTCDGENINPPLFIEGVPTNAKSLTLIVDDPDAPVGTWTHWTIWNIPATQTDIKEGTDPVGSIEGTTSFGKAGYGGPCPPSGTHRYFFKLYALDMTLRLEHAANLSDLMQAIEGHILEKAELIGTYARPAKQ